MIALVLLQRFGARRRVARSAGGLPLLPLEVADQRLGLVVDGVEVLARMLLGVAQERLRPRLSRPALDRSPDPIEQADELGRDVAPDLVVGLRAALPGRGPLRRAG